jgi:hypothetical protein
MKKILFFIAVLGLSSCGPHMYNSVSSGKENASFVIVLTNGKSYENVTLIVDGKSFIIDKVYPVKSAAKAHPVLSTPGKHQIKVVSNVFLGLQETKKIILE